MKWLKKGLIYVPDGSLPWAKKYAYPPIPLLMNDNVLRIYLAFCDDNMVGRAGYVDVDADDPSRILRVSSEPVLDIGVPGAFDENGVVPTSVIRVGDQIFMYYVGYQLGYKVRYFQLQGLAISDDGGSFVHPLQSRPRAGSQRRRTAQPLLGLRHARRRPVSDVVCGRQ